MVAVVSIKRAQRIESNSPATDGYMDFIVTLSEPAPTGGVTIDYRTRSGTAIGVVDYDETTSRLGIRAGETTGTISIHEYFDLLDETDETFTLELFNPVGAVFPDNLPVLRTTGTILDDDGGGSNLAVSVSNPLLIEGSAGTKLAHFEVTLSQAPSSSITIPYRTVNGTATAGEDYAATSGSLTFSAGQVSAAVDVPVFGDAALESMESFSLVLTPPAAVASGANGAAGQATILDDDAASGTLPTISISTGRRSEADNPNQNGFSNTSGYMWFTVNLSKPAPAGGVAFSWRTRAGTALGGVDYEERPSDNIGIQAGETSATLGVYVYSDTVDEIDETVTVELFNPIGGVFPGGVPVLRTVGTILDDDGAGPNLTLAAIDPLIVEGDAGFRTMHFEAVLSRPAGSTVTVPYQTFDGTALANQDYAPTSGVLTFLPGQTSAAVDVPIYGDLAIKASETFGVAFSASTSGPAIAATSAIGTIVNDDSRANRPIRNDVDGDRRADVVWQNDNGAPSVWTLQASAGGAAVASYLNYPNPGSSWRLVGTGDLNGDARADLLWQNSDGLPSAWLRGRTADPWWAIPCSATRAPVGV